MTFVTYFMITLCMWVHLKFLISLQITKCARTSEVCKILIWAVRSKFGRQFYHICGRLYYQNLCVNFDISANHKLCRNIWAEMCSLNMNCYFRVWKMIFITFVCISRLHSGAGKRTKLLNPADLFIKCIIKKLFINNFYQLKTNQHSY